MQFFPETKGLELEAIDHIFAKGGITGGVWSSKGGRTVENKAALPPDLDIKEEKGKEESIG